MSDSTGQTLAGYTLETLLVSDNLGGRYRATRDGGAALMRVLEVDPSKDPGFRGRFEALITRLRGLSHPNVAAVLEAGEAGGRFFVASENVPDGSARTLLRRQAKQGTPLPLPLALELARGAADGLEHAHSRDVLHGEVRPDNMLLARQGYAGSGERYGVKLTDFGLALIGAGLEPGDEAGATASAEAAAYIAPERWEGVSDDHRSDLYSLGVVLYELTTGLRPFEAKSPLEAAQKHLSARPRPPREVRPELPPELDTVVMRCLAKSPNERYGSALELSGALRALLERLLPAGARPTLVLPAARPEPSPPPVPRIEGRSEAPRAQVLDQAGREIGVFEVGPDGLRIGRLKENEVVLESDVVSRHHLRLDPSGEGVTVTDLGSSNGTFVDGRSIPPGAAQPLAWGGMLRVGPYWLRLEAPSEAERGRDYVAVVPEHAALSLTPGQPAVLRLTLHHMGSLVEHLDLAVEGVPAAWVKVPPDGVQLNPGMRLPVAITVTAPRSSEAKAGTYPVTIVAHSRENANAAVGRERATWTVLPFAAAGLALRPAKASGRGGATYGVALRNDGNFPVEYGLAAEDDEGRLKYDFTPPTLRLEPGAGGESQLRIAAPRRLLGLALGRNFQVKAQPVGAGEARAAAGQFGHLALLPPWVPPAVLALLGGLAFGVWSLIARPPVIESLRLVPPEPLEGQPVMVVWKQQNASRIELRPYVKAFDARERPCPNDPESGCYQLPGFAKPTTLTFVATNAYGGQAERQITVSPKARPVPDPAILAFRATPPQLTEGGAVALEWDVKNAESVSLEPFGTVPAKSRRSHSPRTTTTYRLTATNRAGKTVSRTVEVAVKAAPVPPARVLGFSVSPRQVVQGQPVNIAWNTQDAEVTLEPFGTVEPRGSRSHTPQATTTYRLTATSKSGKPVFQSVEVVVKPPAVPPAQVVGFSVSPARITAGKTPTVTFQWATADAVSVALNGQEVGPSGPLALPAPASTTDYTLVARNKEGLAVTRRARVVVLPAPPPPVAADPNAGGGGNGGGGGEPPPPAEIIVEFAVDPPEVQIGDNVLITWKVENARPQNVSIVFVGETERVPVTGGKLEGESPFAPTENGKFEIRVRMGKDRAGKDIIESEAVDVTVKE